MADVSIIIINFNSGKLIDQCIQSISASNFNIRYEIIIVDNKSSDNSKDFLISTYPAIQWIDMGYNAGFARANNQGIKMANSPVVLLLNPDTILQNNALEDCYNLFIQSIYIACGVQLLNQDGSPQISGNYAMIGGLNYLLPLPFLGSLIKAIGKIFNVKTPNISDSNDLKEIDWINGAFLMVKKSAIEKAGLLDEDFFLYAEEAEWCSRLKKFGKLCIFGQAKVTHLQGVSSNETFESDSKGYQNLFDRKGLQIMLSNLVRIRKEFGKLWFLIILSVYFLEIPIFFIGTFVFNLIRRSNFSYRMVRNYCNNVFYLIKLTPIILSNKKYFYKVL